MTSACRQAAATVFGRVPGIEWPAAFLGAAWFTGLLAAWAHVRDGAPLWLRLAALAGAGISLVYVGILLRSGLRCGYCIAAHAGSLGFCAITHWRARPVGVTPLPAASRSAITACVVFAAVLLLLRLLERREQRELSEREAAALERTLDRIHQFVRTDPPRPQSPPGAAPPLAGRYATRAGRARVRLVAFLDYQCEGCRHVDAQLESLSAAPDVAISVRHFPHCAECNPRYGKESHHPNACWAARAAEAAGIVQGADGFWAMHCWLKEQRGAFDRDAVVRCARERGWDERALLAALAGPETEARVADDVLRGIELGLRSTPALFVNGVEVEGVFADGAVAKVVERVRALDPSAASGADDVPFLARDAAAVAEEARRQIESSPMLRAARLARPGERIDLCIEPSEPLRGAADAPVTIVEYGDFECASCVRLHAPISRLLAEHRAKVRYLFRDFPISGHERAWPAALAARAAHAQGRYWDYFDFLMTSLGAPDEADLLAGARALGLDLADFERDRALALSRTDVERVRDAGRALGITRTPTLFVNGRLVTGGPLDARLREVVEAELAMLE